jgi:hypothetical protein
MDDLTDAVRVPAILRRIDEFVARLESCPNAGCRLRAARRPGARAEHRDLHTIAKGRIANPSGRGPSAYRCSRVLNLTEQEPLTEFNGHSHILQHERTTRSRSEKIVTLALSSLPASFSYRLRWSDWMLRLAAPPLGRRPWYARTDEPRRCYRGRIGRRIPARSLTGRGCDVTVIARETGARRPAGVLHRDGFTSRRARRCSPCRT